MHVHVVPVSTIQGCPLRRAPLYHVYTNVASLHIYTNVDSYICMYKCNVHVHAYYLLDM